MDRTTHRHAKIRVTYSPTLKAVVRTDLGQFRLWGVTSKEVKLEERTLGSHDSLMAALSGGRLLLIILS